MIMVNVLLLISFETCLEMKQKLFSPSNSSKLETTSFQIANDAPLFDVFFCVKEI